MFRILVPSLLFSFLLFSCGSETENSDSDMSDSNHDADVSNDEEQISGGMEPVEPYVKDDGTEVYPMSDGKEMIIQQIEDGDCSGFAFNKIIAEKDVIDDDTLVQRRGDSLIISGYPSATGSVSKLYFINDFPEGAEWTEEGFNYEYQGLLETIEYWVVFAKGFEYDKTILIDKFSKKQTETCGLPSVSPDRRFVLVGNADLEVGYTDNHLSLYAWGDDLKLLVKAPLDQMGWSPMEVNWQDDYNFTIKQGRFDESTYDIIYNCAQVSIK